MIVEEALSVEFRVALPWELLYTNHLVVIAETEDEQIKRLNEWKDNVENTGMKVNMNKNALTQNKPPPIRRISDSGLPDPKRDLDRHQNCITWSLSHALHLQKISSKSVHKFPSNLMVRQTNRQTDRQTDKQTAPKT